MTERFSPLVLAGCLLVASAAGAQPATVAPRLELERAVRDALESNASLRATRAGAQSAGAGVESARARLFPRVSFTESWQRSDQPVFVFSTLLASRQFAASNFAIDLLNHPEAIGSFHSTVAVEQLVFDGGARRANIETARDRLTIADLATRESAAALVEAVTRTYGQLLTVQARAHVADAAVASGREDLVHATRRRDAGVATEADVLALTVHVADLEQKVIQARGEAASLVAQINRLTGAPIDRTFEPVEPQPSTGFDDLDLPALFVEAERQRPEIQRATAAERVADHARRAARSQLFPTIGAQAAVDTTGTRFQDRASSWLVGGELRWSLGTGDRAELKSATASATQARALADDVRAQVQVDIVTAREQLRSARARQAVGQAAVAQARESQRIVRDRYEAGLLPVTDVLRAATAVLDSEAQRIAALVDELTSRAGLDHAVGRIP